MISIYSTGWRQKLIDWLIDREEMSIKSPIELTRSSIARSPSKTAQPLTVYVCVHARKNLHTIAPAKMRTKLVQQEQGLFMNLNIDSWKPGCGIDIILLFFQYFAFNMNKIIDESLMELRTKCVAGH